MTRLHALLRFALFLLTVALVATVGAGVFWRYALRESLYWSTEASNFLFVWMVFLGAAVAWKERKHIAFTAILEILSRGERRIPAVVVHVIVLSFALFLVVTGAMVVGQTMGSPSEALKIPQGYLYAVLPASAALIAIDAIADIVAILRDRGSPGIAP